MPKLVISTRVKKFYGGHFMNSIAITNYRKQGDTPNTTCSIDIEIIYNRHVSTIYKICYMMLHNTDDAEDAVQTVFMKIISIHPTFQSTEHEKAWLIVTAQNHCKNILKQSWKRKRVDIELINEPVTENESWKRDVLHEVMKLKEKYRIVIYLYYYEGYSTNEIGKLLRLNPATVRSRLYIGRKNLKMRIVSSEL